MSYGLVCICFRYYSNIQWKLSLMFYSYMKSIKLNTKHNISTCNRSSSEYIRIQKDSKVQKDQQQQRQ